MVRPANSHKQQCCLRGPSTACREAHCCHNIPFCKGVVQEEEILDRRRGCGRLPASLPLLSGSKKVSLFLHTIQLAYALVVAGSQGNEKIHLPAVPAAAPPARATLLYCMSMVTQLSLGHPKIRPNFHRFLQLRPVNNKPLPL